MKTINSGTTMPLKKAPFRAFSSHPFHGWLLTCAIIFFMTELAGAETMYLIDTLEVAVRAGKGLEYKILSIAKSNDKVEALTTEGEYTHIKLANGTEGWILKRYLTPETPKALVIKSLRSRIEKLEGKNIRSAKEIQTFKGEKTELNSTTRKQAQKIEALENQYEDLKAACSDSVKLDNDHKKLQQEMITNRREFSMLKSENEKLRENIQLKWFVAGALAVLIGFIIGFVLQNLRHKRRRRISF